MSVFEALVVIATLVLELDSSSGSRPYYFNNPYYRLYKRRYQARQEHVTDLLDGFQSDSPSSLAPRKIPVERGPNLCLVKVVHGTPYKYYGATEEPRLICGRQAYMAFQCCSGYKAIDGQKGCPESIPLENLMKTIDALLLTRLARLLTNTQLAEEFVGGGAYTVFAPSNLAIQNISHDLTQRLYPWTFDAPSLLHYHVVSGRYNVSVLAPQQQVETLFYANKKLRINKYHHGVVTVNCAKVVLPNQLATNGLLHVINRVIQPLDFIGDVADVILRDSRFGRYAQLLYKAQLITMLQSKDTYFTIFVPNDQAFHRLSHDFLRKLQDNRDYAIPVAKNHIISGIYCGASAIETMQLSPLGGNRLTYQCRFNGNYIGDAKIIQEDIVATNGVVHVLDKVLVPDKVKNTLQVANDLNLSTLMTFIHEAGLEDWIQNRKDYTLFAPTNQAFRELSPIYMEAMRGQPGLAEEVINYHTVEGQMDTNALIGDQTIASGIETKVKINVYRTGIMVDTAHVTRGGIHTANGVINIIDRVLVPPELSLWHLVISDPDLRSFQRHMEKAGLVSALRQEGPMTLIAPSNSAFANMPLHMKHKFLREEEPMKRLLDHHVINRMLISRGLDNNTTLTLPSKQQEMVRFRLDDKGELWVNDYILAISKDQLALNGILFKVDQILDCDCGETKT